MAIKKSVKVPLIDAPVGLFYHGKTLCVKTEYFTDGGVDAYIVSSGEYFHGGTQTSEERNNVMVCPVNQRNLRPVGEWKPYYDYFTKRQVGWICTNCSGVQEDLSNGDTNFCPNCGAWMEDESECPRWKRGALSALTFTTCT